MKLSKAVALISGAVILLANFEVAKVVASITPLHLWFVLLCVVAAGYGVSRASMGVFLFLVTVPLFSLLSPLDRAAFASSFVMWVLVSASLAFVVYFIAQKLPPEAQVCLVLSGLTAGVAAAAVGIAQFILNNVFGADFYNFFGAFQGHPHLRNELFGLKRSTSVFLEPSQFGWITLFFMGVLLYLRRWGVIPRRRFIIKLLILTGGIASSVSSSAFVGALLLGIVVAWNARSRVRALALALLAPIFLMSSGPQVLRLLRFEEIATEQTSGWIRVVVPILALKETLEFHPVLGRGLGQQDQVDPDLEFSGNSVHSAVFGYWIVFGLGAGSMIGCAIVYVLRRHVRFPDGHMVVLFPVVYSYVATGSFVSLEGPYLLIVASALFMAVPRGVETDVSIQPRRNEALGAMRS